MKLWKADMVRKCLTISHQCGHQLVSDWARSSKSETADVSQKHDVKHGTKIRPNRMKVSTVLPTEEDLAAVKRKKKVVFRQ